MLKCIRLGSAVIHPSLGRRGKPPKPALIKSYRNGSWKSRTNKCERLKTGWGSESPSPARRPNGVRAKRHELTEIEIPEHDIATGKNSVFNATRGSGISTYKKKALVDIVNKRLKFLLPATFPAVKLSTHSKTWPCGFFAPVCCPVGTDWPLVGKLTTVIFQSGAVSIIACQTSGCYSGLHFSMIPLLA